MFHIYNNTLLDLLALYKVKCVGCSKIKRSWYGRYITGTLEQGDNEAPKPMILNNFFSLCPFGTRGTNGTFHYFTME
jgi:hypothetical protein